MSLSDNPNFKKINKIIEFTKKRTDKTETQLHLIEIIHHLTQEINSLRKIYLEKVKPKIGQKTQKHT